MNETSTPNPAANFIENIVIEDLKANPSYKIHTRFPPEPNGYLHIGHAKSICLNFGTALKFNGLCNLRFDDTNPSKEDTEYVDSIREDIHWLGFNWADREYYASDYFAKIYLLAEELINKGLAFVCDLNPQQMRELRGNLTEPGQESPYRNRSKNENLELFRGMRSGEFPDGTKTLRAKIDMASPNLNMRDPVLYRIMRATHHRTGDEWCIYPMYDFAHPISDALENITHSVCTLEFEDHRPLYDWVIKQLADKLPGHPRQIEFARLNVTNMVMSKRKLRALVENKVVSGWDDPRMPTLSGLRRRGYTPEAIKDFCERIGVAKSNSTVDVALLEHCIREDLNLKASRVMAVLRPLKVVVTNYPEGRVEELEAENNPEVPEDGTRMIPFSRVIYIEKEDFMEEPAKKFFRLAPGREVRLKHAYIIKCEEVIKNEQGEIVELRCTYDPTTKSGSDNSGKKVKGVLHWVSAAHALKAETRLYDYLLLANQEEHEAEEEQENKEFTSDINPNSIEILTSCYVEPSLQNAIAGSRYQFLRQGFFTVDPDSKAGKLVFNRIVSLRDSWAKITKNAEKTV